MSKLLDKPTAHMEPPFNKILRLFDASIVAKWHYEKAVSRNLGNPQMLFSFPKCHLSDRRSSQSLML